VAVEKLTSIIVFNAVADARAPGSCWTRHGDGAG
jgi:hypothetical protein